MYMLSVDFYFCTIDVQTNLRVFKMKRILTLSLILVAMVLLLAKPEFTIMVNRIMTVG